MRARVAVFTLAIGLGIVGLGSAEESGNWFTRMFTPTPAKKEAEKSIAKSDMPPLATLPARRARQAKADLERRQDVCMKLRDLAWTHGDEETLRKVEQLEQRAFDLYQTATNFRSAPLPESIAKKGGR